MTDEQVLALAAAAGLALDAERAARVRPLLEHALELVDRLRELPLEDAGAPPGAPP